MSDTQIKKVEAAIAFPSSQVVRLKPILGAVVGGGGTSAVVLRAHGAALPPGAVLVSVDHAEKSSSASF